MWRYFRVAQKMIFKRRPTEGSERLVVSRHGHTARDYGDVSASPELLASQNQVANLFQNIRQVLKRSPAEVAQRLHTSKGTIIALETGNFDKLPSWPETNRVVRDYLALVQIDPQPSLFVLEKSIAAANQQINSTMNLATRRGGLNTDPRPLASSFVPQRKSPAAFCPTQSHETSSFDESGVAHAISILISKRLTRLTTSLMPAVNRKQTLVAGAAIVAVLVAAITALSSPSVARFARDNLPRTIADVVTTAHSVISPPKVYKKDGMTWIVVSDPRSRRTDRLPVPDE